jgi:hypothetical protein
LVVLVGVHLTLVLMGRNRVEKRDDCGWDAERKEGKVRFS